MNMDSWVVVRKSRTTIGGYRVVKHKLTEDQARAWADSYVKPHEAMRLGELVDIRTAAIAESRNRNDESS